MLYHLHTRDGGRVSFALVQAGISAPNEGGLYAVFSDTTLLYIGRADNLDERIGRGFWQHEKALLFSLSGAVTVGLAIVNDVRLRDHLEKELIQWNLPSLNDKHNPMARVAAEPTRNALRDYLS